MILLKNLLTPLLLIAGCVVEATITYGSASGDGINIGNSIGWEVLDIALADLDGDGRNDLIRASKIGLFSDITISYNQGDGLFSLPIEFDILKGPTITRIATTDFDGDGDIDILLCLAYAKRSFENDQDKSVILYLENSGNGQDFNWLFFPVLEYLNLEGPNDTLKRVLCRDMVVADMNNDGIDDIVLTVQDEFSIPDDSSRSSSMLLYLDNDENAAVGINIIDDQLLQGRAFLDVADFDGDGALDIAVLAKDRKAVFVYFNDLSSGFPVFSSTVLDLQPSDAKAIAAGPLTSSGLPDIVCTSNEGLTIYGNQGGRSFKKNLLYQEEISVFPPPGVRAEDYQVAVYDLDGDGVNDIVTTLLSTKGNGWGLNWLRQSSTSLFDLPVEPVNVRSATSFAFADIDGDGLADLVVSDNLDKNIYGFLADDTTSAPSPRPTAAPTVPFLTCPVTELQVLENAPLPDEFGRSVAMDGDIIVVGAPGAAYVFERMGDTWTQQAKLLISDSTIWFGYDVAIDGDTIVVGDWGYDETNSRIFSGRAHVFFRTDDVWTLQATFNGLSDSRFGTSVAINGDTIVIGASEEDEELSTRELGAVYVFTRTGSAWTQQAKLLPEDGRSERDRFGGAVALHEDTIIVGVAWGGSGNTGSVYVFTRSGNVWTQQAKIFNSENGVQFFGSEVAVHGDTVVVKARDNISSYAYVFTRVGDEWTEHSKLSGYGRAFFSLAFDGNMIILSTQGGLAYVFTRTGDAWTPQARSLVDDGNFRYFEVAVGGDTIAFGATAPERLPGGGMPGSGSAFVAELCTDTMEASPAPSLQPSKAPSLQPSKTPSLKPSKAPSLQPSMADMTPAPATEQPVGGPASVPSSTTMPSMTMPPTTSTSSMSPPKQGSVHAVVLAAATTILALFGV